MITDAFDSVKSDEEVRLVLEEALIERAGEKAGLVKKLENLRWQKKLILGRDITRRSGKSRPVSIRAVLAVVAVVRRMQKASGHLHPLLFDDGDSDKVLVFAQERKKWPFFGNDS
jgi:hypothetical protein